VTGFEKRPNQGKKIIYGFQSMFLEKQYCAQSASGGDRYEKSFNKVRLLKEFYRPGAMALVHWFFFSLKYADLPAYSSYVI
jgi:hypothetical protein